MCYFFCDALISTIIVYSSDQLSLYNDDLLFLFVFNCRRFHEDSDDGSSPDTSSDVSSVSDNERSIGITTQCLAENICTDQEGFSSDDSDSRNQESSPIFQYVEHDAPYGRQPLADMVCLLWFLSNQMLYL